MKNIDKSSNENTLVEDGFMVLRYENNENIKVPKKLSVNSQDGRWFFNMNVVESHEVKNRDYSVSVK